MPSTWRLPVVNGDDGAWGTYLNDFLNRQHYDKTPGTADASSGQHMSVSIIAPSASTVTTQPPLKLTSDSLLGTAIAGGFEFLTDALYFTITTAATRKTIAFTDSNITGTAANVSGTVAITNGGTGQTTAAAALSALGGISVKDYTNNFLLGGM